MYSGMRRSKEQGEGEDEDRDAPAASSAWKAAMAALEDPATSEAVRTARGDRIRREQKKADECGHMKQNEAARARLSAAAVAASTSAGSPCTEVMSRVKKQN